MNFKNISLSLLLLLAVGLSTLLLIKNKYQANTEKNKNATDHPDSLLSHSTLTTYTKKGQIKSILYAKYSTHYANLNKTLLQQPHLTIYTKARHIWHIRAKHGSMINGDKQIKLWGSVVINEPKQASTSKTTIQTSILTYDTDRSFAETEQDVIITRSGSKLQSHGMTVDFKKGILVTKSRTKGTFNESNP